MKYLLIFLMVGLMLASITTHAGGPGGGFRSSSSRPSFGGGFRSSSSRPSFGGFRSGNSSGYRSFSSSPSRTYTYLPSAPHYSAPAPTSRSSYRSKMTVNNHYHGSFSTGSSGGGLGLMDYLILDNMMSRDRGPTYVQSAPVVTGPPVVAGNVVLPESGGTTVVYQEESHFWRNFLFLLIGGSVLFGSYAVIRLANED